jgi:hypothetical protein
MSTPNTPPDIFGLPPTPVWAVAAALCGAIFGHWLGRRRERESKKEASRLALVSCVSAWIFKVENADDMIRLRRDSFPEIEIALFAYVPHVQERRKNDVESALREYRDIEDRGLYACDIVDHEQKLNAEKSARAKKLIVAALTKIKTNANKG